MTKKEFITNVVFYGLIILLIWAVGKWVLPVLIPFIIGFIFASLIRLPIKRFYGESKVKNKLISILACIIFYAALLSLVMFVGINMYQSIAGFLSSIPEMYNDGLAPAIDAAVVFIEEWMIDSNVTIDLEALIREHITTIGEYVANFSANAIKLISGGVTKIPALIIRLVVMVIATFFSMIDYELIIKFFRNLIPESKKETVDNVIAYFKNTVAIYAKSYLLLFLLTFTELVIGFSILRIDYAPLIAILVAVFDILPILGVGGILLPWSVVGFVTDNLFIGVGMLILYLIIAFIRNIIEPKLVGDQIGLHPLVTLIFMYLGLRFLGFLGMFLFPVTLSVIVGIKREQTTLETN